MSLLFVYGTLLPGQAPACVADLVARFRPVGPGTVPGVLVDLGSYPGLVLDNSGSGRVVGQLLELPDDDPTLLRRLDAYEGFDPAAPGTSFFRRVPTIATLADGRSAACDVYVYNRPTAAARAIASGDWQRRHEQAAAPENPTAMHKRPIIGITTGLSTL